MALGTVIWVGWEFYYPFVLSVNLLVASRGISKDSLILELSPNSYSGFLILVCFCCIDDDEKEAGFSQQQAFLKERADLAFLPLLSQIG